MKLFIRKIQIPLSIIVGVYAAYWLIVNPFEEYTLPIIIIWIPDIIGWNAFFVLLGLFAGLATYGTCLSFTEEDKAE
jgi:hypothetical protein